MNVNGENPGSLSGNYVIDHMKKDGRGTGSVYRVWYGPKQQYVTGVLSLTELKAWWAKNVLELQIIESRSNTRTRTHVGWRPEAKK